MNKNIVSADHMDVSIIIPTHNQSDHLQQALLSLQQLSYSPKKYEVIVVDDNSSATTETMVKQLQKEVKFRLVYKKMINKNGISTARNLGMNIASGRFFLFSDDDCMFERDWLQRMVAPFSDADVGAVGGPDRAPRSTNIFSSCVDYLFTSFIGTGGLRVKKKIRLGRYYPKGNNMAVSRKVISKIGRFNENLQPGEDIEMAYRIEQAGYRLVYVNDAPVWHKRTDNLKKYLRKMFQMGYHRVVLGCLHSGLIQIGHYIPFLSLILLLIFSVYALFSRAVLIPLVVFLLAYALAVFLSAVHAGFKSRNFRKTGLLLLLIPLHHFIHAAGVLFALMKLLIRGKIE